MIRFFLKTFLLIVLCVGFIQQSEAKPRIAWFKSSADSGFWPLVERFMIASANNLGVELEIHSFNGNPVILMQLVQKELVHQSVKPDAILFHNEKSRGKQILEICEKQQIPAFLFNAGFSNQDGMGKPRERYRYWIGSMLPDDFYAGYLLSESLVEAAKNLKKNQTSEIQLVAIEGNRTSEASNERVRGLKHSIQQHAGVRIKQFFHSKWREQLAFDAFRVAIDRYPDVTVFWTASDNMAIGVIKSAKEIGKIPGYDFVTGGIDLLPQNQGYLQEGSLTVSVGGHYAEGAWALILLYDYLMKVDFAETGTLQYKSKMIAATGGGSTLGKLSDKLSQENLNKLDFRRFSRAYNPKIQRYQFDLDQLLNR